jgi:hypothetical protein
VARRPNPRSKALAISGEAWRAFAQTPDGSVALAELMVWCNVYSPIETSDPIELARLNGERNVAMRIVQLMGSKPGDFLQTAQDDTDILDRMMRQ